MMAKHHLFLFALLALLALASAGWRESEYSDCSVVPTACRSALCDSTTTSSDLWSDYTGIDIMTHGTGSPQPTSGNRYATGIVLPDGTYLLIDAGTGIARDLGTYKCQDWTVKLRHFAMTHYHSDHIGDMGFALNLGFVRGRRGAANKVQVYGPQGLTMLTDSLRTFYAPDAYARVTQIVNGKCEHVGNIGTADSLWFNAHEFFINETNPIVPVFSLGGANVTAMLVNHISFTPAVGFVIQTDDVKIVLSGDTAYSPLVEAMSVDADYLIHEVTNQTWANEFHQSLVASGAPNADTFYCGGLVAHTSIEDVAALAQRSRVKNLILSHILPEFDDKRVLEEAIRAAGYTYGNVYAANDGDYWKVLKNTPAQSCTATLNPTRQSTWVENGQSRSLWNVVITPGQVAVTDVLLNIEGSINQIWEVTPNGPHYSLPDWRTQAGGIPAGESHVFGFIVNNANTNSPASIVSVNC